MNKTSVLEDELQLINMKDDECCIIFDFGCYFPYVNDNILSFNFSIGDIKIENYKLNHRYPNRGYKTISRTYGRKVSKVGYIHKMKLNEQRPMLLRINIGVNDKIKTLIFPINTKMTKEKPFCVLEFHYMYDKRQFVFSTYESIEGGWKIKSWINSEEKRRSKDDIIMEYPKIITNDLPL